MSQTTQTQNKASKKVATTTTGSSSAATLSSLVSKKKSAVPVLECKRDFKDDGNDDNDDEEKRSSEEEDTSDDCEDEGNGEIINESSKKNKISSKIDQVEYAKLLAELFPSKYSKKKALTIESSAKKINGVVKEQKVEKQKCENITATVGTSNSSVSRKMKNTETAKLQSAEAPSTAGEVKSSSSAASNSNVVGNYNIVINIKEPFEDLLEEDDTSDMDDSVYDDESASSNDNSSDETYNDDDETSETDDDEDDDDTDQDDDDDSDTDDADADAEESKCEKDDAKTKYGFEKCKLTVRGKNIVGCEKTSGCISSGKNKKPELLTSDKGNDHDYDNSDGGWNTEDETTIQAIKAHMEDLLAMDKNNKIARTTLVQMIDKEKQIKEARKARNRKVMRKNVRKFGRLLHKKNSANDLKYFKKHLSNEQQVSVLGELEELNKMMLVEKPYRLTLLESKIPKQYKAIALKRIQNLRYMDPGAGEYYKVKNWVDTFMTIPFGVNKTLPITMEVGVEQCHHFMESAKDLLDSAVYGLNDAKMQIMQMVG